MRRMRSWVRSLNDRRNIFANAIKTGTLTGCALLATILATASTPGFAQQPAFPPPTATEVFALRDRLERLSTCAQLAKKIWDTRGGHSADWGDPTIDLRYETPPRITAT
jgi:hypothetical protein